MGMLRVYSGYPELVAARRQRASQLRFRVAADNSQKHEIAGPGKAIAAAGALGKVILSPAVAGGELMLAQMQRRVVGPTAMYAGEGRFVGGLFPAQLFV